MSLVNSAICALFDALLSPFRALNPLVGLTLVSLVVAILMLLVFKRTSNQKSIDLIKRKIHASLFEIRLFNDDLVAILRAQIDIARHNLTYIRLSLRPLIFMIVPLVLIMAQLQFHYAYRGLRPGEPVLLTVRLKGNGPASFHDPKPGASVFGGAGVKVETPSVWVPAERELVWRISGQQEGDHEITIRVDGASESKTVRVRDDVVRRSPLRVGGSLLDQILYPAEPPLGASSPIASIELDYPDRDVDVLGFGVHWMIVFFALSMIFAFALRRPFGVTI
ncbi:MAG: hypothetical protein ABI565_01030 [Vicinamibacteria bacterium]